MMAAVAQEQSHQRARLSQCAPNSETGSGLPRGQAANGRWVAWFNQCPVTSASKILQNKALAKCSEVFRLLFLSPFPILPAQIQKKSQKNILMTAYSGQGTPEQIQICWLLAPDLSLALALRGADAMWTVLFSVTFVIAVALQLAVLSQVDE
ncbi:MAG: hypothetical protein WAL49_23085 [Pseudolabrys sp.]